MIYIIELHIITKRAHYLKRTYRIQIYAMKFNSRQRNITLFETSHRSFLCHQFSYTNIDAHRRMYTLATIYQV